MSGTMGERPEGVEALGGLVDQLRYSAMNADWYTFDEAYESARTIIDRLVSSVPAPPVQPEPVKRSLWVHDLDGPTETIHDKREPWGEDCEWTQFVVHPVGAVSGAPDAADGGSGSGSAG